VAGESKDNRRRVFVDAYLENGFHGTKAAITAGYAESGAHTEAWSLLKNPEIREQIESRLADLGASRARIIREQLRLALEADIADFEELLTGRATLADLKTAGVDTRAIKRLKVNRRKVPGQSGDEVIDVTLEMYDRQKALDALSRLVGADAPHRIDHTTDGESINPLDLSGAPPEVLRWLADQSVVTDPSSTED